MKEDTNGLDSLQDLNQLDSSVEQESFADLVGRWTLDPAFDEVIASQRKIDPAKWS